MRLENFKKIDMLNNKVEVILGQVVSKANNYMAVPAKGGEKRIIKTEALREYERSFCRQCKIYRDKNIDKPFEIYITVYESSWRYDVDNAVKTILDCLQYVNAIKNDNLCIRLDAQKRIDAARPRVEFYIVETAPKLF